MTKQTTFYLVLCFFLFISTNIFSQAPVITKQPSNQGVIEGQTATFYVEVTGDTLTYQWYKDGTVIGGATDSIYTTAATVLANNGSLFSVKVTNNLGKDSSNAATLYVTPAGQRVTAGEVVLYNFKDGGGNIVHDVSGVGNPVDLTINKPSNVMWTKNGLQIMDTALINTSTAARKVIDSITTTNEISVELWIRPITAIKNNIVFALTSGSSEVDFFVESYIQHGYNWAVRSTATDNYAFPGLLDSTGLGTNLVHLVLTHSADGVSKIYRDGIEVASKNIGGNFSNWNNQARISLSSYISGDKTWEGIYYLAAIYDRALDSVEIVHNYNKGTTIDDPLIVEQPQNLKVLVGSMASFKISALGYSSLSYQWQKNGSDIPGATDSSYTIPQVSLADSGNVYRVIVSNSSGKDTSNNAVLSVENVSSNCPDGIIHYYHLSESSSPYKDTVGFSDGTSSNSPSPVSGVVGTAQNFSSQEKINISKDESFDWNSNESFSIEFWMKTNTTPSDNEVIIGRKYDPSTSYNWWVGINANAKAVFQLASSGENGAIIGDKGQALNDGSWHLIAAVRDNVTGKNYLIVDGVAVDSSSVTYTKGFQGSNDINLGYLNFAPFYYYSGSLDEVAFYRVALTASETQNQYNKGLKGLGYCQLTIAAPSNLKAIRYNPDSTKVEISWKDNSLNELGFVVQRKLGDSASVSAYANIDTVTANTTTYIDTTVTDTTKYTYRLYAYNADTVSVYSNIATYTTPLPVELTSFSADAVNGKVMLSWVTATEINNSGFSIEKSSDNKKFEEISFIKGKGSTAEKSYYSYVDKSALSGKYYYRLKQIDLNGTYQYSKSVEIDLGLPKVYSLEQNYPNPFNPSTKLRFALPASAKVIIKIYNTLGQEVANILHNELNAGVHEIEFNGSNLSSGVYFYRLEAHGVDGSNFISTKRMLLMK